MLGVTEPNSLTASTAAQLHTGLDTIFFPPMTVSTNISQVPAQGAKCWGGGAKKWIQSIPLPLGEGGQFQSSLQL